MYFTVMRGRGLLWETNKQQKRSLETEHTRSHDMYFYRHVRQGACHAKWKLKRP